MVKLYANGVFLALHAFFCAGPKSSLQDKYALFFAEDDCPETVEEDGITKTVINLRELIPGKCMPWFLKRPNCFYRYPKIQVLKLVQLLQLDPVFAFMSFGDDGRVHVEEVPTEPLANEDESREYLGNLAYWPEFKLLERVYDEF